MENYKKNNCLSPSILSADYTCLGDQIQKLDQAGAQYIHIDVMDGVFVPSISMGFPVIRAVRSATDKILDVHLMIQDPQRYIEEFVAAGADLLTVHAEACPHLDRTIQKIKEMGILAGVALNPATPITELEYILSEIDMVLIMTVNPGFGGQALIPYTIQKVRDLKQMIDRKGLKTDIQVDGGINLSNVNTVMDAGANIIVAGSSVFQGDIEENVTAFLELMRE